MSKFSWTHETRPLGRVFSRSYSQSGYTVVELLIVLVVLGILAANTMPRFFEAGKFEEMGYADTVGSALGYAQKVALATRCDTRVRVDSSGYGLFQRATSCTTGAFTRPVMRPGAGNWSGSTPLGIAVGSMDLYFDSRGRPRNVSSSALYTASQNVGIGTRTLTVEHTTGYTHSG